jgi:phage gp16-like protein
METPAKPKTTPSTEKEKRDALIRLVHTAWRDIRKRKPELDEEDYRAQLRKASGGLKESTSVMTVNELNAVMKLLRAKPFGFRIRHKARPQKGSRKTGNDPLSRAVHVAAEASKVRAIWLHLHQLGEVDDPNEAALNRWVKRQTGVDDLRWVPADKMEKLIEAIKFWRLRVIAEKGRAVCPVCCVNYEPPLHPRLTSRLADGEAILHCVDAVVANLPLKWVRIKEEAAP